MFVVGREWAGFTAICIICSDGYGLLSVLFGRYIRWVASRDFDVRKEQLVQSETRMIGELGTKARKRCVQKLWQNFQATESGGLRR